MNVQALANMLQQRLGVTLTAADLAELAQTTDTGGRSPIKPRQLNDLRLLPRADDPRPTFYASAQVPRDWDTTTQHEFPKLMWTPEGTEVVILNSPDAKKTEKAWEAKGYSHIPPADVTPFDAVEREMRQLTDEERAYVLDLQRQARIAKIQDKLGRLTESELAMIGAAAPAKAKK